MEIVLYLVFLFGLLTFVEFLEMKDLKKGVESVEMVHCESNIMEHNSKMVRKERLYKSTEFR